MRDLRANQQKVYYKNYLGYQENLDEDGNRTGTKTVAYSELKSVMLCVSPNKGSNGVEEFGSLDSYDKTMSTSDTRADIGENSILWIDEPDTTKPHDYIVLKVARWKNSIAYAIRKVKVNA